MMNIVAHPGFSEMGGRGRKKSLTNMCAQTKSNRFYNKLIFKGRGNPTVPPSLINYCRHNNVRRAADERVNASTFDMEDITAISGG